MRTIEEYIPKSQRFTPEDEKGGTLTWKVRVSRPGFRPKVVERSMRKDYHVAEATASDGAPVEAAQP